MKELLEEGGDGLTGLARALLEAGVNEMMAAQADAACEAAGTTRNGFRERRLETQVGTITLRIPKLRQGTYFPDGLVERWSRVDRAVICAVAEMCALGVSTRKVGRVLERMGADRLSKDAVSRICSALDAEVAELVHGQADVLQRDAGVEQTAHDLQDQNVAERVEPLRTRAVSVADGRLDQPGAGPVVELAVGDPGGLAGDGHAVAHFLVRAHVEQRLLHAGVCGVVEVGVGAISEAIVGHVRILPW